MSSENDAWREQNKRKRKRKCNSHVTNLIILNSVYIYTNKIQSTPFIIYYFLNPTFISAPTVRATWLYHFIPLHFTNQYNSVSSANHEATLYITLSSLLLPPPHV